MYTEDITREVAGLVITVTTRKDKRWRPWGIRYRLVRGKSHHSVNERNFTCTE